MRASDKAYAVLRGDIVEWRLSPGTVLGEVEQSERLGVSRTPLREALGRLTADGLAVQQRGRGAVVSDVSLEHVDQLFELREALELQAVRTAARRSDPMLFETLADRFLRAAQGTFCAEATGNYYRLASELDQAVVEAAANQYLDQALRGIRLHLARIRRLAQDDPMRLAASASEHATIASAIASGSPEYAAAAMLLHLRRSLEHIKAHA